jgi:hypothetical protein
MDYHPLLYYAFPNYRHYLPEQYDKLKTQYEGSDSATDTPTSGVSMFQQNIEHMKDYTVAYNGEDFEKLLSYIETDMSTVKAIVFNNVSLFTPFARNFSIDSVFQSINNISQDVQEIRKQKFQICRFNSDCKYKECCANIHEQEFQMISKSFKSVQHFGNKVTERPSVHNASAMLRNLFQLELNIWNLLSRKSYGKSLIALA